MIPSIYLKCLHRFWPRLIWKNLAKKSKKIISQPYFILSFDCDTQEDINVALEVHTKLQDLGITPTYAVPGELLKKGEKTYRKIFQTGAEFINHGGRAHTYFDNVHQRYKSCFFYDQQSLEDLKADITGGHRILQDVLGIHAQGWRTPHFGTFQQPHHLKFLYAFLQELNYQFSTSTSPAMGYTYGPLYKTQGIIEIPVTGVFTEPFNIMDTWGYFTAPDRSKNAIHYQQEAQKIADFMTDNPLLINIYGDPSHIYDKLEFFQAMAIIVKNATNINYDMLLKQQTLVK